MRTPRCSNCRTIQKRKGLCPDCKEKLNEARRAITAALRDPSRRDDNVRLEKLLERGSTVPSE